MLQQGATHSLEATRLCLPHVTPAAKQFWQSQGIRCGSHTLCSDDAFTQCRYRKLWCNEEQPPHNASTHPGSCCQPAVALPATVKQRKALVAESMPPPSCPPSRGHTPICPWLAVHQLGCPACSQSRRPTQAAGTQAALQKQPWFAYVSTHSECGTCCGQVALNQPGRNAAHKDSHLPL